MCVCVCVCVCARVCVGGPGGEQLEDDMLGGPELNDDGQDAQGAANAEVPSASEPVSLTLLLFPRPALVVSLVRRLLSPLLLNFFSPQSLNV